MQFDDTFTFKKLVGGKYVTEKVKKREIDDSFNFTVVKNKKKLKLPDKIDKNEIFFEFQVVKENKKENKIKNKCINLEENKEKNQKVNNLKIKKPIIKKPVIKKTVAKKTVAKKIAIKPISKVNESPKIDETLVVKSNPLLLYKQIKGPDRFKELLIKCSLFLKDGDFKKNLPSFIDKLTICVDLQNLKGEINNLNLEIEKWRKIKEEKINELKKIEIKSIKINLPEINHTPGNVLEEGKKSLLNAITYLEKRVERLNVVAEDMIEKNIKPKPRNCTVLLAELAKLD